MKFHILILTVEEAITGLKLIREHFIINKFAPGKKKILKSELN